jgi:hypothetical protein
MSTARLPVGNSRHVPRGAHGVSLKKESIALSKSPHITIKLTHDVQTILSRGINLPSPVHAHHESQPHSSVPVERHPFQFMAPSYRAKDELHSSDDLAIWRYVIWAWRSVSACRHVWPARAPRAPTRTSVARRRARCPIRRRARRRRSTRRRPRSASASDGRGAWHCGCVCI